MALSQVNGVSPDSASDGPHSAFLQHLLDYPVIHDGVATFKSNPLGQKSLAIGDSAYKTIFPYLSKPYQYISPIVKQADDLGDKALAEVDKRFPVVKKPTNEVYNDARALALSPFRIGLATKDKVLSTYADEKKKANGDDLITNVRAVISTAKVVAGEALGTVSTFIRGRTTSSSASQQPSADGATNGNTSASK
ncbi:hypothetical protein VTK73DRAFT_8493 [Phialemonium thermophilum]|uniref:CAP20 n=1 Tax=Phialemonium thermophilum TaxID=223376 RepID=A0ABR3XNL9_9PEZI